MNQEQYLKEFKKITDEMYRITLRKNSDYASEADAFKNFRGIDFLTNGQITAGEGILVRMTDKIQRIANLMYKDAVVKDEAITDTLIDLANYSIILSILLKNK